MALMREIGHDVNHRRSDYPAVILGNQKFAAWKSKNIIERPAVIGRRIVPALFILRAAESQLLV
jgi:hypothetical protein